MTATSYAECNARRRLSLVLDPGTFAEWITPEQRVMSPHLDLLGIPAAFDDGVAVGSARLDGRPVFAAAQEGAFMGGGVGEVHGAKLVGMYRRALLDRPQAVLLLLDSGGVRLHEANAGLIAVSEVMRAMLNARAAGIPTIAVVGGMNGCFGGMGIACACADWIVMSDVGRLALSGPEVIESSNGVEEFDARDRGLVWRTTGGKHRWLSGDCDVLVEDDVVAFRDAAIRILLSADASRAVTTQSLVAQQSLLQRRAALLPATEMGQYPDDAVRLWAMLGVAHPESVADSDVGELTAALRST